jgi:hypothetical protein
MKYAKEQVSAGSMKAIRFDSEDEQILKACCDHEKLSLSDTVRRAVRAYAKQLGIETPSPKSQRPRKAAKK